MRFIDRLISFIFDLFVIVLAVTILLVTTNIINYSVVDGLLNDYVFNADYNIIVIAVSAIVILAGLKITVFSSTLGSKAKKNILVDTEHGRIQIAQETIENIAKNVIKNYSQVKDVQARMAKASRGINMYMVLLVYQNTNIKDVVTKVQSDVKAQIEATTSVPVRNVDVKIRNVVAPTVASEKNKNNKHEDKVVENTREESTIEKKSEELISKPATGEYMKDENDVLYKVEPNPNSESTNQE